MAAVPNNKVVSNLLDAVSQNLGRPAHCRKVLNRDEWFVYDPVFSFLTRAKNGGLGYRVGYQILEGREVVFSLVHNPVMAKLFKHNLTLSTLLEVASATAEFRRTHWIYRSSKLAWAKGLDGERIERDSLSAFVEEVEAFDREFGFIKDLFHKRKSSGNGDAFLSAGNTFSLGLSDKCGSLKSKASAQRLVDQSWPLCLCLYPIKPIEEAKCEFGTEYGNSWHCESL